MEHKPELRKASDSEYLVCAGVIIDILISVFPSNDTVNLHRVLRQQLQPIANAIRYFMETNLSNVDPVITYPSSSEMDECARAFRLPGTPSNPVPFLRCLIAGQMYDGQFIRSNKAKAIMWVILSIMYPHHLRIDMEEEFTYLHKQIK